MNAAYVEYHICGSYPFDLCHVTPSDTSEGFAYQAGYSISPGNSVLDKTFHVRSLRSSLAVFKIERIGLNRRENHKSIATFPLQLESHFHIPSSNTTVLEKMVRTKPGAKTERRKREPDSEVRSELRSACKADDIQRVAQLLNSGSTTAADVTACLDDSHRNLSTMRLLLEHGADPATYATTRCMGESIELIKLLVEFGHEIKINGHWILQCVISCQENMQRLHS
jgi:hypothetical protein